MFSFLSSSERGIFVEAAGRWGFERNKRSAKEMSDGHLTFFVISIWFEQGWLWLLIIRA